MGVTIEQEGDDLRVLRVAGLLRKSELDLLLNAEAKRWSPATRVKVLVIAEGFEGWERNADWGDMDFFTKHNSQITKIAIVADPKWHTKIMMFTGAGLRRAAVKSFSSEQAAQARAWLAEPDA